MPNSTTKAPTSNLYLPDSSHARPASQASSMQSHIEKTMEGIEDYARREPWAFASWVFGIGFVLGWKLKPW